MTAAPPIVNRKIDFQNAVYGEEKPSFSFTGGLRFAFELPDKNLRIFLAL